MPRNGLGNDIERPNHAESFTMLIVFNANGFEPLEDRTRHSMWATQGWRFGDIVEARIQAGGKVVIKSKVYPSTERFTEKDAERFSQMNV